MLNTLDTTETNLKDIVQSDDGAIFIVGQVNNQAIVIKTAESLIDFEDQWLSHIEVNVFTDNNAWSQNDIVTNVSSTEDLQ